MPYKAMIVEDNAIYRYAVKTIIDWRAHGFDLAAEAINGKQALQVMDEETFDLILTDVSMPEMNGIDLIEAVKRRTPDTVVVMLSSFDDFQFVKDSLKLGAQDYLLKHDLEPESLARLLDQVRERLEQAERLRRERQARRAEAEAQFMRRAMLGEWEDERELARQAEAGEFRFASAPYRILALAFADAQKDDAAGERCREVIRRGLASARQAEGRTETGERKAEGQMDVGERQAERQVDVGEREAEGRMDVGEREAEGQVNVGEREAEGRMDTCAAAETGLYDPQTLSVRLSTGRWGIAVSSNGEGLGRSSARSLADGLIAEAGRHGLRLSIGVSEVAAGGTGLSKAYEQAAAALFQTVYEGWGRVYASRWAPTPAKLDPALVRSWLSAMRKGEAETVKTAAEALIGQIRGQRVDREQLRQWLFDGFSLVVVLAGERRADGEAATGGVDWHARVERALQRMEPPERLLAMVMDEYAKLSPKKAGCDVRGYRKEIQQAIDYIHAHYAEEITLPGLAAELGFSPNYLSNLFRGETGMRLTEYVTRHRMDVAKHLLQDTRLKVYEVAERVGYPDASYFCKVFKEVAGLTVSEFRRSE
ncbi:response regulator [Cohnella nanjingensis]|uniref:Response regulator n=1 Tax=Cohnella nanjingensis TaxID=1387779 RepID=A0A7X0VIV1_9BACL|nr:response regulator [Cohnella nanjingensis]MBB6675610.1 response regulator [Cohnella nanjingensis]